jgi:hypothetical protein
MAKKFGKAAAAEVVEEVVEEVEVEEEAEEVEVISPIKKAKAAAPVVEEADVEEVEVETEAAPKKKAKGNGAEKPKGAPRARKYQYGPIGTNSEAKIMMVKDAVSPKGVADQAAYIKSGMTVAAFFAAGGDRHGLRVMMRGKFIVVRAGDQQYPQTYDHVAAEAARKAREAAKAAKEAAADEEEEAPAPVAKPAVKKVVKRAAA